MSLTLDKAIDRVRDEMAKSKDGQLQFVGEIVTALLQVCPEVADLVADEKKDLAGALAAIRRAAVHNVTPPDATAKAICGYYGIKEKDMRRLAVEVNCQMLGVDVEGRGTGTATAGKGATPSVTSGDSSLREGAKGPQTPAEEADPFDLDALLASGEAELRASASAAPTETRGQAPATDAERETGGM